MTLSEKKFRKKNLCKLLNLNFTKITTTTENVGKYDLPYITAEISAYPDYIALYGETKEYNFTERTYLAFYKYDAVFDNIFGLYNAIYYDIQELQNFYLERFKGVKYFIAPDYSLCDDINHIENLHRIFRSRIVSIWLTLNLKAMVIPNITYSNPKIFPDMLTGMQDCKVVAFSTKGLMRNKRALDLLKEAVKYTADNLQKLRTIIIYTTSINDEYIYKLFEYAAQKGIKLIIPDNRLRNLHFKDKRGEI